MTFDTLPQPQHPLTIMGCVRASYAVLWQNRMLFLKTTWIPIILLSLSAFVTPMPHFPVHGNLDPATAAAQAPQFGLASFAFGLAAWFLAVSYQVTWQRFLVLGDRPSAFYFKAPFWSYLGTMLLLMLAFSGWLMLSYIPALIIGLAASHLAGTSSLIYLLIPVILACIIPALIWFFHRILVYPGRALGNTTLTWKQSSLAMRGHTWTYFGAGFLAYLPFMILSILLMVLVLQTSTPFPAPLLYALQIIQQFFAFAGAVVGSCVLTYFYVALIDRRADNGISETLNA